ncbi:hypothetical protein [Vogesella indigofera]|uniref:hypothetical protein n=1 Tax=Vogesella indigofera TaxID=45465 RepID=UPI00234F9988|nr:hypothetical protein [Vogesella indigofera]MDC7710723.1 hypothetical protein [Vogesella indigofera]
MLMIACSSCVVLIALCPRAETVTLGRVMVAIVFLRPGGVIGGLPLRVNPEQSGQVAENKVKAEKNGRNAGRALRPTL